MKKASITKKMQKRADARLSALLRSPKAVAGLVMAVADIGVSKNFVYGWLSNKLNTGEVIPVQIADGETKLYILGHANHNAAPAPSLYPSWLDPRQLPNQCVRRYVSNLHSQKDQEESENNNGIPGKKGGRPAKSFS